VQEVRAKARAAQRAPEARAKSRAARRVREIIRAKAQPRVTFLPLALVAEPSLILTPYQKPLRCFGMEEAEQSIWPSRRFPSLAQSQVLACPD